MFGPLGGPELLLVFVVALIIFGPRKLPEMGKSLGKMIGEFRRASNDLKRTIEDEVEADRLRQLTSESYGAPGAASPPGASVVPPVPLPGAFPASDPSPPASETPDAASPAGDDPASEAPPAPDPTPDATREP